ncbi:hypothetical protein GCM10009868_29780 [Terrabacter aerolatus]|uniref:Uncharacterized protein n=1 Tax=Terrabacter aerolatus TaxID=422442 RepID=A0A512CXN2_9MICO|nr:hypothetical protein TAE01_07750 [Terrabacter aerolatus]
MIASPAYVLGADVVAVGFGVDEVVDVDFLEEAPLDELDAVPVPVEVSVGCWPDESVADADEDPEPEPLLPDDLLVVVTVRVSAATRVVELREVL